MYKVAQFSVRYPTTILMAVLAVVLLGYISFGRLGMDLLPDLNNPRLYVEVTAGDRPPEEMEDQFVSRLEAVAARGRKVDNVASISRVGRALITVQYSWDADMDEAFLDLQKSMADFSQNSGADEITVSQHDPNAVPIVEAILSHPEISDLDQLRQTAENVIRNELIRLPGIAAVELVGARQRQIEIVTDAFMLEAYGLTIDQLASSIISSNRNMTGGSIVEMGRRYVIRGVGEYDSKSELEDLIVTYKTQMPQRPDDTAAIQRIPIYLREIASVNRTLSEPENIVRFNGQRCVGLQIFKEARFNTIDAAANTHQQLANLSRSLPGYNLQIIRDQSRFVKSAVTEVEQAGILGIVLAMLVLYVFLRRIGVTAVISIAIPISIIATFNLMYFNNLTLNIMTLGGLALGAGMLVDNAIVVMENIFRHLQEGKSLSEAAVTGAGEVGGAITSSTLTTVVVFLPIVYLHGAAGELFREQAWTVAYSLICSLFVALAVIPMLCSKFLKKGTKQDFNRAVSFPTYAKFLNKVLDRRYQVVIAGVALVIITIIIIPFVGSEFMPDADQGEMSITLTMPEGTNLDRTEGAVRNLEELLEQNFGPQIKHLHSRVGPAGSTTDEMDVLTDENTAEIQIALESDSNVSVTQLVNGIDNILGDLPDIETQLQVQQTALQTTLGTTTAPLVVEIKGKDLDVLESLADSIETRLRGFGTLTNIETSFQQGRPEINIEVDRTVAAQFSLDIESIGSQLRHVLSGREAGQMQDRGEYIDITLKRPDISLSELQGTLLEAPGGRLVRIDEVANLVKSYSPREIIRNNQTRIGQVTAHLAGEEPFDKIAEEVRQAVAEIPFPPEYTYEITGEEKLRQEAFGNLQFALFLAIILVYMVMAAQFESLLHPFVILLTVPLAAVGAIFLLLMLNMPLNMMSFIGIIMLAGIAVNDAIILVDRINQNRRSGQSLREAISSAGQTRIRPIIMTSLTTILALLPLTIGIGEGASLRAPMAVAVIGGLVSSTILSLVVIPAVYHLLAGKVRRVES